MFLDVLIGTWLCRFSCAVFNSSGARGLRGLGGIVCPGESGSSDGDTARLVRRLNSLTTDDPSSLI